MGRDGWREIDREIDRGRRRDRERQGETEGQRKFNTLDDETLGVHMCECMHTNACERHKQMYACMHANACQKHMQLK